MITILKEMNGLNSNKANSVLTSVELITSSGCVGMGSDTCETSTTRVSDGCYVGKCKQHK